jgi:hypothetical protein
VIAALIGVVVGVVLGLNLTNRGWSAVGDALVPAVVGESRPLVAALVSLPVVGGVVIGLLSLLRSFGGEAVGLDRPSVGARVSAGLPTAAYVGWLVAFAYAYNMGLLMPDWRLFAAAGAGIVVTEVVLVIIGRWRPGFDLLTGLTIGVVLGLVLAFLTAIAFIRSMQERTSMHSTSTMGRSSGNTILARFRKLLQCSVMASFTSGPKTASSIS